MNDEMDDAYIDDDDNYPYRRIGDNLDLLLSQAQRVLGEATYREPYDLLDSLNYLGELEAAVQRELDFAVISLREVWNYRPGDIAYAMNRPWEHDYSHKVVPIPDAGDMGTVTWREALSRYRAAMKRQFGVARSDVYVPEDWDQHRRRIQDRWDVIHGLTED